MYLKLVTLTDLKLVMAVVYVVQKGEFYAHEILKLIRSKLI